VCDVQEAAVFGGTRSSGALDDIRGDRYGRAADLRAKAEPFVIRHLSRGLVDFDRQFVGCMEDAKATVIATHAV
jgi:hypothetical protein